MISVMAYVLAGCVMVSFAIILMSGSKAKCGGIRLDYIRSKNATRSDMISKLSTRPQERA